MTSPATPPSDNAPTVKAPLELSMLVIGDSGTGKTEFIRTLPKPFVFDFDKGMKTLEGSNIPYMTFKDAPAGTKVLPFMAAKGIYERGTAWTAFIKQLNIIGKSIDDGTCPYETLCFDSLTTLSDLAMNNILKVDGHVGAPQIQHWGGFLNAMSTLMDQLTSWPLIKYLTAHIMRDTNDLTKAVEMLPFISGQMKAKIPIYFDEIYFAEVTGGIDKAPRKYVFRTQSTSSMKSARSRVRVPDMIGQDFKLVRPFLGK